MTIYFQHILTKHGSDTLSITGNHGIDVSFLMGRDNVEEVYLGGYDLPPHAECLTGLFVGIGTETISIRDLIVKAEAAWPAIKDEIEEENRDALRSERELTSPRAMGMI